MTVARTARLTIRLLRLGDAPFILRLLNEPSFLEFIGDRGVRDLEGARRYLKSGPLASYRRFGFGLYLVTRRSDGAALGMCGLLKRNALDDVDIGFAFLPEHWSQGYAHEAAEAVLTHARRRLRISRVVAVTTPGNRASIRLLEKLGLRRAGTARVDEDGPELELYTPDGKDGDPPPVSPRASGEPA